MEGFLTKPSILKRIITVTEGKSIVYLKNQQISGIIFTASVKGTIRNENIIIAGYTHTHTHYTHTHTHTP